MDKDYFRSSSPTRKGSPDAASDESAIPPSGSVKTYERKVTRISNWSITSNTPASKRRYLRTGERRDVVSSKSVRAESPTTCKTATANYQDVGKTGGQHEENLSVPGKIRAGTGIFEDTLITSYGHVQKEHVVQKERNAPTFSWPSSLFGLTVVTKENWKRVQARLPNFWKWDLEYHNIHVEQGESHRSWTCTPLEPDEPSFYPLEIANAPVVLPVEYTWPPASGVMPPPDPRPSSPIDCRAELPLDVVRDLFLSFEGSLGFYLLINGLLQIIVPEEFDTTWASSHLPHKYGGLKVCYISQTMEATMLPNTAANTGTDSSCRSPSSGQLGAFEFTRPSAPFASPSLTLNDFIEARPLSNHKKDKYSGRIGLKVAKDGSPSILMSTHVITEAIMAKSYRDVMFDWSRGDRFERLKGDCNDRVEIRAGTEKIGKIEKTFDTATEIYPIGFRHDVTLIEPTTPASVKDIISPVIDLGWLNHDAWASLRQQTSTVKFLGPIENHREAKSINCSRPSEILIVGEGIFLNQASAAVKSKNLKDHDVSTWKDLVSRAVLYRVYPDFDPPNGYSGIALYANGKREDGTEGPGIVGFQSFVQRSGHVQKFDMEGPALEQRLQRGRVAFYGAFEVPAELKSYDIV